MNAVLPDAAGAAALQKCLAGGGVAVFPADTVYGLACDPSSASAFERLYEMKGRAPAKPAAVMYFSLDAAVGELELLPARTRLAARALLPGPVTLLLPNPSRRFPLACEPGGAGPGAPAPLGLRVPAWPAQMEALRLVGLPALQSSANLSGGPAPGRLGDVPRSIRDAADLVIDGGELPGLASTVIDVRDFESAGAWSVLREGALTADAISEALADLARDGRCGRDRR